MAGQGEAVAVATTFPLLLRSAPRADRLLGLELGP